MIRPPGGLPPHRREGRAGAEERAGEVDGDGVDERLHVDLVGRTRGAEHARVVEQHVDPAEPVVDRGEQRVHRGRVGDVGGDGQRVGVAVGGRLERVGPPARQRHAVPGPQQRLRHDPAQPRARPRHHRHAIRHRPSLPHSARRREEHMIAATGTPRRSTPSWCATRRDLGRSAVGRGHRDAGGGGRAEEEGRDVAHRVHPVGEGARRAHLVHDRDGVALGRAREADGVGHPVLAVGVGLERPAVLVAGALRGPGAPHPPLLVGRDAAHGARRGSPDRRWSRT